MPEAEKDSHAAVVAAVDRTLRLGLVLGLLVALFGSEDIVEGPPPDTHRRRRGCVFPWGAQCKDCPTRGACPGFLEDLLRTRNVTWRRS